MSRLIVKNLPNNVTCESLKEHFSQKGVVTDVQLKYTKKGEFRHFGFVGYQSEEQAKEAIEYFNNTYIRSVRIEVQPCSELGDASKPKSWSKYAPDSSAYKKLHKDELEAKAKEEKEARKKKKKEAKFKNKTEEMISEKMKKHKNDPLFLEYLEAHGKDASNILEKLKVSEDSGVEDEGEDNKEGEGEEGEKEVTAATAEISDLDYLKLKMKPGADEKEKLKELVQQKSKEQEKAKYYTVKISELPYNVKKPELKELFRAYHPTSIRLPPKKKGFAYIGFKTEQNMRQALSKNKSFVGNKQILVKEFKGEGDKEETKEEKRLRWKRQEEALMQEENIGESGRIFARNLAYTVTEDELEQMFSKYGPVTEVTVPVDRNTRQTKGFAHITFLMPEHAVKAHMELDGKILHGRMLHLLPGKAKPSNQEEEGEQEGGQYKQKKAKKQKETATHAYNWNTLFMGQNAVADLIAQNYNTTKEKVLMGDDTAVRLALGETQIVAETREFLEDNGVKLEAFNQAPKHRSKTVLLVKNLPVNTTAAEIRDMFAKHGELGRIVLPPSGVTGIVEFLEPSEARAAFVKLAYTKFKNLPLYLEWAPDDAFTSPSVAAKKSTGDKEDAAENGDSSVKKEEDKKMEVVEDDEGEEEPEPDTTLFIKNLNFSTNEETIKDHFSKCGKISSVTIARKKDPAKPGALLSMGYGFVQFYKKKSVDQALKLLQQSLLDGHSLELKRSNKTMAVNVSDVRKKTNVEKQTGVKILVRNIPFQATQKEIDQLFRVYGEIKSLRLPKKMVGTGPHRGFCFVEYLSKNDAKRAMKALCQSTHLYGRRLVLEWARGEDTVDDIRKRTADNFLAKEPSHHKRQKATADLEIGDREDED